MRRNSTLIAALATTAFLGATAPAHALLGLGLSASTLSPANVASSSTVLRGSVSPLSLSTSYHFEVGPTTSYGTKTPTTYVTALLSSQTVQATITGLKPSTTYHYRIVASELLSTVRGSDMTFRTAAASSGGTQTPTTPTTTTTNTSTNTNTTDPNTSTGGGDSTLPTTDDPQSPGGNAIATGVFPEDPVTPTNVTPVLGETIAATPAAGTVRVRLPGSAMFVPLEGDAALPLGTVLDARKGTVSLLAARDAADATQAAQFQGAVFQVRQPKTNAGLTDVYLRGGDFRPCWPVIARGVVAARAHRRHRTIRRLWGHDRGGRFRTHGQRAVATVRGTTWMVADRCDGTLTKVTEGAVSVRDRGRKKSVLVKAGRSYLARARR